MNFPLSSDAKESMGQSPAIIAGVLFPAWETLPCASQQLLFQHYSGLHRHILANLTSEKVSGGQALAAARTRRSSPRHAPAKARCRRESQHSAPSLQHLAFASRCVAGGMALRSLSKEAGWAPLESERSVLYLARHRAGGFFTTAGKFRGWEGGRAQERLQNSAPTPLRHDDHLAWDAPRARGPRRWAHEGALSAFALERRSRKATPERAGLKHSLGLMAPFLTPALPCPSYWSHRFLGLPSWLHRTTRGYAAA